MIEFLKSGFLVDPQNYMTLLAVFSLAMFPACAWIIEKLAARGLLPNALVVVLAIIYLTCMLAYPIVMIQWIGSLALSASFLMLFTVSIFLKLTSFHHVCYDNRYLMERIKQAKKTEKATDGLANFFNVNDRTFSIALQYPNNLDLWHYLRFLLAPTCCYQYIYPTTPNIRMGYLCKRVLELMLTCAFMFYLIEQHML